MHLFLARRDEGAGALAASVVHLGWAREGLAAAAEVARSDPAVHAEACAVAAREVHVRVMTMNERVPAAELARATGPCDRSLLADRGQPAVVAERTRILVALAAPRRDYRRALAVSPAYAFAEANLGGAGASPPAPGERP